MPIFFYTDTHFCHSTMIKKGYRHFDYENKIENSLSKLELGDTLIHFGDICMSKNSFVHKKFIEPIECRKILIKGNHDDKKHDWYLRHGWDYVYNELSLSYLGKKILFSHIPVNKTKYRQFDYNIHGHLHDDHHRHGEMKHFYDKKFNKLLSIESSNYKLIESEAFMIENKMLK